jgi:hypothetical protein
VIILGGDVLDFLEKRMNQFRTFIGECNHSRHRGPADPDGRGDAIKMGVEPPKTVFTGRRLT